MFYYLYEIRNNLNNKIYIGVHKTFDLEDDYMGSGKAIRNAIKKYGIENFTKNILEFFDNSESMYQREREIVTEEFITQEDTYNMRTGGRGGWDYVHQNQIKGNKWHSFDEQKKADIIKRTNETRRVRGIPPLSEEKRKEFSEYMKLNNPMFDEANVNKVKNKLTGVPKTKEHKEKISKSLLGRTGRTVKGRKLRPGRKYSVPRVISDTVCPFCNKAGKLNAMKRWHFDNCKSNNQNL